MPQPVPTGADRPRREIRLLRPPSVDGVGVFGIRADGRETFYTFAHIACEIGGRGFAVHRLGLGNLYHVRIGAREDCSCDCLGFLSHRKCKHVEGLLALADRGKI